MGSALTLIGVIVVVLVILSLLTHSSHSVLGQALVQLLNITVIISIKG